MTKLRISRCDAVVAQNEVHHIVGVKDRVIQLLATNGDGEIVRFTHDELAELINNGTFTIIYGYFSDRLVARRAIAGRALLDRLPTKQKWLVLWKEYFVRTFLEAEKNREVSRSDVSFSAFRKELHRRVNDLIMKDLKKPNSDKNIAKLLSWRAPCRGSVMKWIRLWSPSRDPMTLVKRSMFNAGNAKNIGAEREAIIQAHIPTFLSPQQINIPQLHKDISKDIRKRNKARKLSEQPPLPKVSLSTVERRVKVLSNFEIIAARDGLSVAKNKLGAHTGGIEVWAPLERVEMDEWQIDLMAILSTTGLDFTDERFRDLEVGRYWICVAMDAASRSILGIKLSRSPCAEDAKAVLWMAMRDKSQISKQLGCKKTWKQHGHVHHVIVDNGAAFVDAEFKACLSDLSIEYDVLPAGVPKLRGGIERLFLTLAKMLMPYLTGRTFSNPQERGEYPSEKYAVHTAESIIEILVRFVVDAYHLRSHRGLEHATPNDEWDRLCDKFGWSPPRDRHVLRHALGISYKRRSGRHGVLVCGVNFHSRELERHFKQHGAQDIDLRIDPEDFGHVSAWLGDAWCTLHAMVRGLDGMAFATWEGLISELRQKNRTAASLNQEIIERAIERVKEIDEQQRSSRLLGPITISADDIRRADRETFWGLNLGSHSPSNVACGEGAEIDLLSDEIGETQSDPEEEQRAPQDNNDAAEYWRFSDDDE